MSMAKVATAATSLVLIGGSALGTGVMLTSGPTGIPYLHFLFEDEGYNKTTGETNGNDYTGKYGETYGRYLVGISDSKVKKTTESNVRWWLWAFNNRYTANKSKAKGKFSSGINDKDNLKTKCAEAYKATNGNEGNIKTTITGDEQNKFLESNIWLFCSPAEEKIKSVNDENRVSSEYTATSIYGDDDATKKDLVSVLSESKGNTWFWNFQKDKYKDLKNKGGIQIINNDVKEWCKQAYKSTSNTTPYTKENVFKWCSLSGKTSTTSQ